MLHFEVAKQRQEDLLREAQNDHLAARLSPQQNRPTAQVQAMLARWHAMLVSLGETRPIRRRASAWLNPR